MTLVTFANVVAGTASTRTSLGAGNDRLSVRLAGADRRLLLRQEAHASGVDALINILPPRALCAGLLAVAACLLFSVLI